MKPTLLLIHLLIAALVTPLFLMLIVSGGLYLSGIKGSLESAPISLPAQSSLDFKSDTLKRDVDELLSELKIDHDYEYIKNRGSVIQLRPTSRPYLEFEQSASGLTLTRQTPNLQKTIVELHKGHGPRAFKRYQQAVALSLFLVVLSGLWMGLTNRRHRGKTLAAMVLGSVVFLLLAFS